MSRMKDIIEERIKKHKEEMCYIESCDIKEEVAYFFEESLLTQLLDSRRYKFITTSDRFVEMFRWCIETKYDKRFKVLDVDKLFISIVDEIKSYVEDIDYFTVKSKTLSQYNVSTQATFEIFICIDPEIFI